MLAAGELNVTTRICMPVSFWIIPAIACVWTLLIEPGGRVDMPTV